MFPKWQMPALVGLTTTLPFCPTLEGTQEPDSPWNVLRAASAGLLPALFPGYARHIVSVGLCLAAPSNPMGQKASRKGWSSVNKHLLTENQFTVSQICLLEKYVWDEVFKNCILCL